MKDRCKSAVQLLEEFDSVLSEVRNLCIKIMPIGCAYYAMYIESQCLLTPHSYMLSAAHATCFAMR